MSNKAIKTREEIYAKLREEKTREVLYENDIRALYEAVDMSIHFVSESIAIEAISRTIEDAKRKGNIYAVTNTNKVYLKQFEETR